LRGLGLPAREPEAICSACLLGEAGQIEDIPFAAPNI
jgi:hypothetical protein